VHTCETLEIHPMWDEHGLNIIAEIPKDAGCPPDELRANAVLIASAPQLLEALKGCVTLGNAAVMNSTKLSDVKLRLAEITRIANTAIDLASMP
jgi:hypothetical protein